MYAAMGPLGFSHAEWAFIVIFPHTFLHGTMGAGYFNLRTTSKAHRLGGAVVFWDGFPFCHIYSSACLMFYESNCHPANAHLITLCTLQALFLCNCCIVLMPVLPFGYLLFCTPRQMPQMITNISVSLADFASSRVWVPFIFMAFIFFELHRHNNSFQWQ